MADNAHTDHVKAEQDHYRWSADHMRALAVLKRAEAAIYTHESEVQAHRLAINQHEHGEAAAGSAHEGLTHEHDASAQNHERLMAAILGLEKLL
ncbi:MAG: hypothetical protein R6W87_08975 [Halospina sp.]